MNLQKTSRTAPQLKKVEVPPDALEAQGCLQHMKTPYTDVTIG